MVVPFFVLVCHVDADEVCVLLGSACHDFTNIDDLP